MELKDDKIGKKPKVPDWHRHAQTGLCRSKPVTFPTGTHTGCIYFCLGLTSGMISEIFCLLSELTLCSGDSWFSQSVESLCQELPVEPKEAKKNGKLQVPG